MTMDELEANRDILRSRWHDVRNERLELKSNLLGRELSLNEVRHDRAYKRLKKEQKHMSKLIKHIENEICRMRKNGA